MRTIVHKLFWAWSSDKEEKWLNEMAAKGWCLVSYGFCRYEFEDCLPGEYEIRIELLEHMPCHPESQRYMAFLEETGVEQIGSWHRWVYFRKKAAGGRFELFSDHTSRIRHLNRILWLIGVLGAMNLWFGVYNVLLYAFWRQHWNMLGLVNLFLGMLCVFGCIRLFRKKKRLRKDQVLFE